MTPRLEKRKRRKAWEGDPTKVERAKRAEERKEKMRINGTLSVEHLAR